MKYIKTFKTKYDALNCEQESPFVCTIEDSDKTMFVSTEDAGKSGKFKLVLSGDELKTRKIIEIIFKINDNISSVLNINDMKISNIEITADEQIQTLTLSDGSFTIASDGELSYEINKSYALGTMIGDVKADYGSNNPANAVVDSLSNYAWYKYNLSGNSDWGCWKNEDMANKAAKWYGVNGGNTSLGYPDVNWSRFTWAEYYESYDGNSLYQMNPYGASAVRSGKGYHTHEVGLKLPNHNGLYDMTGNVSEWCDDSNDSQFVGGSFINNPSKIYLKDKWVSDGNHANDFIGMRVATPTNVTLTGKDELKLVNGLYIAKCPVTKQLWSTIMAGNSNGVSTTPSKCVPGAVYGSTAKLITGFDDDGAPIFTSTDLVYGNPEDMGENPALCPVDNITRFDAMYFCNLYSSSKGLSDYYVLTDVVVTDGHITSATVTRNENATGFRMLTNNEWLSAAAIDETALFSGNTGEMEDGTSDDWLHTLLIKSHCYPYYDTNPDHYTPITLTAYIKFDNDQYETVTKTISFSELTSMLNN